MSVCCPQNGVFTEHWHVLYQFKTSTLKKLFDLTKIKIRNKTTLKPKVNYINPPTPPPPHKHAQYSLHALRSLLANHDELIHAELGFFDVEMLVQGVPIAPLRDNGQVWLGHQPHEQQDVIVPGLPQHSNLILECLHLGWCWFGYVELLHRHRAVPVGLEHRPKRARTNPLVIHNFLVGDFPVFI